MKASIWMGAGAMLLAGTAQGAAVNLSTWTNEGGGNWSLAADNNSVRQTLNGPPTVFYSDFNGQGIALSGEITVQTGSDDDYIGFVLGFSPGDVSAAATDFILVDWKQGTQPFFGCTAQAGLAVSRVTGGLPDNAATWCHNSPSVTELARGSNLGSVGWADNTTYAFDLLFTAAQIQVFVDGVLELDITGTFNDGRFGFYNYSQSTVLYSAIEEEVVPPGPNPSVPEPATLVLLGAGIACYRLTRRS